MKTLQVLGAELPRSISLQAPTGRILSVPPVGERTAPHPAPHPMGRGIRPAGSRVARGLSPQPSLHLMERGRRGIAWRLMVLTRCARSNFRHEGERFGG